MKKLLILCAVSLLFVPSVGCRGKLLQRFRLFQGAPCSHCGASSQGIISGRPAAVPTCNTGTCNSVSLGYPSENVISPPLSNAPLGSIDGTPIINSGDAYGPSTGILPPAPGPVGQ